MARGAPVHQHVRLFKSARDEKLGLSFARSTGSDAVLSRIAADGPAAGWLCEGDAVLAVGGVEVSGPLHAAQLLRESVGEFIVTKCSPLSPEQPRRVPRERLELRLQHVPPPPPDDDEMPLSARLGLFGEMLSARAGELIKAAASLLPLTDERAAVRIQRWWRMHQAVAARRYAVAATIRVQAAYRGHWGRDVAQYRRCLLAWAALMIQEAWRHHVFAKKLRQLKALKSAEAPPAAVGRREEKPGMKRTLSWTRRSRRAAKEAAKGEADLQSARPTTRSTPKKAGAPAAAARGAARPTCVRVSAVLTGGAAHGVVRGGDVVRVVNGVEVHDHEHATAILRQCAGEVDMWVERQGEPLRLRFDKQWVDKMTGLVVETVSAAEAAAATKAAARAAAAAATPTKTPTKSGTTTPRSGSVSKFVRSLSFEKRRRSRAESLDL